MMRQPAEVFPPGEFLREELEARGWTQTDFAEIIKRPLRTVNEIIAGKRGITAETAEQIANALGTSAQLWLNLETAYQLSQTKSSNSDEIRRRARLYEIAPIQEMVRRGWIKPSDDVAVIERQVLDFFEISSLDEEPSFCAHAARKSSSYAETSRAQVAWLCRARQLARNVAAATFSKDKLKTAISRLRTLVADPEAIREVPRILSEAGVRLVIVEPLVGSKIDGAVFWIDDSPVIALSLRYQRIDSFWFTLFHELGHIQSGNLDWTVDVDIDKSETETDRPPSEKAADLFASESLIPSQQLENFIDRVGPYYSARQVEEFARQQRVHSGIVVGQLQHRGKVPYTHFRKTLTPVRQWIVGEAPTDGWGIAPKMSA